MVFEADLGRRQTQRGGEKILWRRLSRRLRQLRAIELGEAERAVERHAAADDPDLLLDHHDGIVPSVVAMPLARQTDRRADRRMPGEGKLLRRRQDADARGMRRVFRREHEDRLRQIELARDRLHRRVIETVRIEHDGERISRERAIGEDVEDFVAPHLLGGQPSSSPCRRACWP